jgi:hypothetical protein
MKLSDLLQRIVFILGFISLFLTVTNAINLSVLFFLNFLLVFVFFMRSKMVINKVHLSLLFIYIYFLLSVLFYSPSALVDYTFYRRDGNFFITFLPLLIYAGLYLEFNVEQLVRVFLIWTALVNFFCMVLFVTHVYRSESIYFMLFHAHNAAGGFLSVVCALSFGLYWHTKNKLDLIVFLSLLAGLYLTHSRGSLLAFVCAFLMVVVLKERFLKTVLLVAVLTHLVMFSYTYPIWIKLDKKPSLDVATTRFGHLFSRAHTFADRALFLWPTAIDLFFKSPFLGTGFGSYNDLPHRLVGIEHVAMINRPDQFLYNDSHAHHSFLHILAECGFFGFFLVCLFLFNLRKWILNLENLALSKGLLLAFWVNVLSSCTEHRLFTPSQMLPFILIIAFLMANENSKRLTMTN